MLGHAPTPADELAAEALCKVAMRLAADWLLLGSFYPELKQELQLAALKYAQAVKDVARAQRTTPKARKPAARKKATR